LNFVLRYLADGTASLVHDDGSKLGIGDNVIQTQSQFMSQGCETICAEGYYITGKTSDLIKSYKKEEREIPKGKKYPDEVTFAHYGISDDKYDDSMAHDCVARVVLISKLALKIFGAKRLHEASDGHPTKLKNVNHLSKEANLVSLLNLECLQRHFSPTGEGKGPWDGLTGVINNILAGEAVLKLKVLFFFFNSGIC
jgi:hypothetical protein